LFNLDTFRDSDFQVDQLISRLTEPILNPGPRQRPATHVAGSGATEAMAKCGRLLEQFERCGGKLSVQSGAAHCTVCSCLLLIKARPAITAAMVGLRRAEKDLARLQKNVDTRVEALQRELGERHAAFTVPSLKRLPM